MSDEPRDPATDPFLDLRRFPQDPQARQFWESVREWRRRTGLRGPTPRLPGDDRWRRRWPHDHDHR